LLNGNLTLNFLKMLRFGKNSPKKTDTGGGASDPRAINNANHRRQMENLINSLETDASHLVDGREGRKSVEIILAIYQSSREGRIVELPLPV
jgi:predicted dehydrogenase